MRSVATPMRGFDFNRRLRQGLVHAYLFDDGQPRETVFSVPATIVGATGMDVTYAGVRRPELSFHSLTTDRSFNYDDAAWHAAVSGKSAMTVLYYGDIRYKTSASTRCLFGNVNVSGMTSYDWIISCPGNNSNYTFFLDTSSGVVTAALSSAMSADEATEVFLAARYNGSVMNVFLREGRTPGLTKSSNASQTGTIDTSADLRLSIAHWYQTSGSAYQAPCRPNWVALYNRALSDAEIAHADRHVWDLYAAMDRRALFAPAAPPAGGIPPAMIGARGALGAVQIDGGMLS